MLHAASHACSGRLRKLWPPAQSPLQLQDPLVFGAARNTTRQVIRKDAYTSLTLHVYFPDPWPKKKHRRHRLINENFPALAHAALAPGGVVYLRTDDADYFSQMTEVFGVSKEFSKVETPAELTEVLTDFERDFNAQGIPTLRAAYQGC